MNDSNSSEGNQQQGLDSVSTTPVVDESMQVEQEQHQNNNDDDDEELIKSDNHNHNPNETAITKKEVIPPELPLEWTQLGQQDPNSTRPIRYPSDVMEFSSDETYLEIIGTAGQKITHMGKDLQRQLSPDITHLIFRSHLIAKMEGIRGMKCLELLELYDNQVEYLEELDGEGGDGDEKGTGFHLKTLDMSYNVIRDMEPVMYCPNLVELCKYNVCYMQLPNKNNCILVYAIISHANY